MAVDRLENQMLVTIAVCTYGRPDQILNSLDKLSHLMNEDGLKLPVLIIDNNKENETKLAIKSILSASNNFQYIKEETVGLSHARNRAVRECKTEYIAFMDDDAFPNEDYFNELLKMCKDGFDVAGGGQIPYSDLEMPSWYKTKQEIEYNTSLASGFNMAFRVSSLLNVGLFDPKLGMNGKKTAYGEDILPQVRIKKKGGKFIYNENLLVHHYIQPYKLTKKWQLISSYAHGRDGWRLFERERLSIFDILYLIKVFFRTHLSLFPDFEKQKSMAFEFGRIIGSISHLS
jgi:GT2 family glycosyltransferase